MLVAKRAMTSVHPSALSALMYRKFVNSQRKENPHDLQQNFPAKINTKHYDYPLEHLICNHFSRKEYKSGSRKVVLQSQIFFSGWRKGVLQTKIFF